MRTDGREQKGRPESNWREVSTCFDQPDRDRIRQSLLDYENAAVTEWNEAASGRQYPAADEALARLRSTYEGVQTHNHA
jgi:hypothetical protein